LVTLRGDITKIARSILALFDTAWVAIFRLKLKSQKYFALPRVLVIFSKEVANVSIIYLCQNI